MTQTVRARRTIAASADAVFACLADYKQADVFIEGLEELTPLGSETTGEDARFDAVIDVGVRTLRTTIVISSLEPARSVTWSSAGDEGQSLAFELSRGPRRDTGQPHRHLRTAGRNRGHAHRPVRGAHGSAQGDGRPRATPRAPLDPRSEPAAALFSLTVSWRRPRKATENKVGARPPLPCEGSKGPCTGHEYLANRSPPRAFSGHRQRRKPYLPEAACAWPALASRDGHPRIRQARPFRSGAPIGRWGRSLPGRSVSP